MQVRMAVHFSGDGTWSIANSIVYANDAAGADKNIQIVSNSATDQAANCAIDVTAYDAGAWMATNITTLDASPFVGGSGADSLMLPHRICFDRCRRYHRSFSASSCH